MGYELLLCPTYLTLSSHRQMPLKYLPAGSRREKARYMLHQEVVMDMLSGTPKRRTMRSSRKRNGINKLSLLGIDKDQYWQEWHILGTLGMLCTVANIHFAQNAPILVVKRLDARVVAMSGTTMKLTVL